jgi:ESS family glutamate:Na+ symporter
MFSFGTLFSIFFMFFIGKRINRNFWFERSIVMFGWNTGSIAISIVLLRIIDPNTKTSIMEDFGLAYVFISPIEITIITILPSLIINNVILLPSLILIFLFFSFIFLSKKFIGWSNNST